MKEFRNIGAFVLELAAVELAMHQHLHNGLEKVAQRIEKTAKDEIGTYQQAIGPFDAWEELHDATKADRVRQGFTENDPGLRTGEMRDSIEHRTEGLEAEIGSNDEKLVWFELGTDTQEPRAVLGTAVEHNHEAMLKILGHAAVTGLLGGQPMSADLEYDHEV
jgi:hypothetical protein